MQQIYNTLKTKQSKAQKRHDENKCAKNKHIIIPAISDCVRKFLIFLFLSCASRSPSDENILSRSDGVTSSIRLEDMICCVVGRLRLLVFWFRWKRFCSECTLIDLVD